MGTPAEPAVIRSPAEMTAWSLAARARGERVAFVPTMGALHEGHVKLLREARGLGQRLALSIFVNPTQFGPNEDLARYPRDLPGDLAKAAGAGTDVAFVPDARDVYPAGFQTTVEVRELARGLCGPFRPGHFAGVATVVCKLFNVVRPDVAVFGEKDFQQLKVVTQLARDLDLPTRIVPATTVREADGLALSSRNRYLSPAERQAAPTLHRVLTECAKEIAAGAPIRSVLPKGRQAVESAGFILDYLEARHAETLAPITSNEEGPVRLLIAAKIGKTRLIDNVGV